MATTNIDPCKTLLHYITYTRSKFNNYATCERQIPTRDMRKMIFPKDCTSFELFDKACKYDEVACKVYVGEVINRTQYYIGTSYTLVSLAQEVGGNSEIYRQIAETKPEKIVKIYGDEFLSVRTEDYIIPPQQLRFANDFYCDKDTSPAHEMSR